LAKAVVEGAFMKRFIGVIDGFGLGSNHSFLKIERVFQSRVSELFQNRILLQMKK